MALERRPGDVGCLAIRLLTIDEQLLAIDEQPLLNCRPRAPPMPPPSALNRRRHQVYTRASSSAPWRHVGPHRRSSTMIGPCRRPLSRHQ
jgi:hypothetical protein